MTAAGVAFRGSRPWSSERIQLDSLDVEEATAGVGSVFHRHELTRVESVPQFHAELRAVTVGPLVMGRVRYNSSSDLYCPRIDGYHVNVPLAGALVSSSNGRECLVASRNAVVYGMGADATLLSPSGSKLNIFAMKIDPAALQGALEDLLERPVVKPVDVHGPVDLSSSDGRAWWSLVLGTYRGLNDGSMLMNSMLAKPLAYSIIVGLLALSDNEYSEELHAPTAPATPSSLVAAVDFIHDNIHLPLTPGDVARGTGIGVRALQRGFREHHGASPSEFIRRMRLSRAHDDLVAARTEDVCVSTIANRWGFHHHGRFAEDYRRMYGVPPSCTLRQV